MTELATDSARAVLGSMILDPNALAIGLAALRGDAMDGRERSVLEGLRGMQRENLPVDLNLLVRYLERIDRLAIAGGPAGVASLLEYGCALVNLEAICAVVNGDASRRALRNVAQRIITDAEGVDDAATIIDRAEKSVLGVREGDPTQAAIEPLAVVLDRVLSKVRTGIRTGFGKFDWATGGLHPKQLVTIGARPGMGKTAIAASISHSIARAGSPVLFFSLEMDSQEIGERLLALQGIPLTRVGHGGQEVLRAAMAIRMLPISVVHLNRPTVMDLRAVLRRSRETPALVVVDFMQLVHPGERCDSRAEAVEAVARGLKWMASEFDVPVLALAQLNRNTEERGKLRRPVLSDLRESGGIEVHSDVVAFLHRAKYYEPNNTEAELIVAKNRQGPIAAGPLVFRGEFARFDNLEREHAAPEFPSEPDPPAEQLGF